MNELFIGREKEQKLLNEYVNSEQSEFIAVYGRRRVGKTFLIQQVIKDDYAYYVAGMNNVTLRMQLDNFIIGDERQSPHSLFQLVAPFTLFHFQIVKHSSAHDPNYWSNN